MDFETYKGSLADDSPPDGLNMAAQALWWEAKGDWHGRINARRSRPTRKVPGRTPTSTVSKAICRMPAAGIAVRAARSRPRRCKRNGRRSRGRCWVKPPPQRRLPFKRNDLAVDRGFIAPHGRRGAVPVG